MGKYFQSYCVSVTEKETTAKRKEKKMETKVIMLQTLELPTHRKLERTPMTQSHLGQPTPFVGGSLRCLFLRRTVWGPVLRPPAAAGSPGAARGRAHFEGWLLRLTEAQLPG